MAFIGEFSYIAVAMKIFLPISAILLAAIDSFAGAPPKAPVPLEPLFFGGRWVTTEEMSRTSSPAAAMRVAFSGTSVSAEIEGKARWKVTVDGKDQKEVVTDARKEYILAKGLGKKKHMLTLTRKTECLPGDVRIYAVTAAPGAKALPAPKLSNERRIEFIGDSYTVAYGVEAKNGTDGTAFTRTNTTKGYAYLAAQKLNADYQINAFSGRGLVRNFEDIVPEWTIPTLYEYAVPGMTEEGEAPRWDFAKWHPQVIVLFVGINDWQGHGPYPETSGFDRAYAEFMNKLRKLHPGVKFLLVSTKIWPEDSLTPRVKAIFEHEKAEGRTDVDFTVVSSRNTALDGHPGVRAQKAMSDKIAPLIARLAGWTSK